jgi:predicted nucleic acid-binding protein
VIRCQTSWTPFGDRATGTDQVRLVVDSSVIVGACLAGGKLGPLDGHELVAPAHLAAEVTSSIREQAFRGVIPADRALEAVGFLPRISIEFERPGMRATEVASLATDLGWAKTYDAEYVALARLLDCPLVTIDERLRRGADRAVRVLGPTEL